MRLKNIPALLLTLQLTLGPLVPLAPSAGRECGRRAKGLALLAAGRSAASAAGEPDVLAADGRRVFTGGGRARTGRARASLASARGALALARHEDSHLRP